MSAVIIEFVPCSHDQRSDCQTEEEMKLFHADSTLVMASAINYIDLGEIESIQDSVKKSIYTPLALKHDMDNP